MGPCGKAAAGHEESNHTSGCSYFALLISESGWARSAGFSWINLMRITIPYIVVHTPDLSSPSPVRKLTRARLSFGALHV
jgi:hypothetical protein